jgi:hypothetical protein
VPTICHQARCWMVGTLSLCPPSGLFEPCRPRARSTSLRANGSRECAPDDRLREAIHLSVLVVIMDCFATLAMTMWRQWPATNRYNWQITSDYPKSCQAPESKILCFRSRPNHPHNSACLTADEGRWPSSRTCGEMRWT